MDTARQLIRWSIPGAVFLLFLGLYFVIFFILCLAGGEGFTIASIFSKLNKVPISVLLASSIPVGFIIYQIYFWFYGNVVLFKCVSLDKGAIILQDINCEKINKTCERQLTFEEFEREIQENSHCERMYKKHTFKLTIFNKILPTFYMLKSEFCNKEGHTLYKKYFYGHWDIVRYHLKANFKNELLQEEYTSHFDIYHALGAGRWAIILAYLSFVVVSSSLFVFTNMFNLSFIILLKSMPVHIALLIGTLFLIKVFSTNRTVTLYSIISLIKHSFNHPEKSITEKAE